LATDALAPIRFVPEALPKPWGAGEQLRRLGVSVPEGPPTGEVWLVSDVPGRPSVVASGPFQGKTLADLVRDHGDALLGRARHLGRFPLLVKLLEVGGRLSLQVHPDASAAARNGDGPSGKFEAWSVLDVAPGARVTLGLDRALEPGEVRALIAANRLEERLNSFTPRAGDAYVITPGMIHAASGGVLLLEVQETADVTYRLYDWGTVGLDGKPRQLHVEKGLACAALEPCSPPRPLAPEAREVAPGARARSVVAPGSGPFAFDVLELDPGARVRAGGDGLPCVYVALEGRPALVSRGEAVVLAPGEAALWPAALEAGTLEARGRCRVARALPGAA
jgi:mannose-6-phosphate isomerase